MTEKRNRHAQLTLRVPSHLRDRVRVAALRDGVDVNTWINRALEAGLQQQRENEP